MSAESGIVREGRDALVTAGETPALRSNMLYVFAGEGTHAT